MNGCLHGCNQGSSVAQDAILAVGGDEETVRLYDITTEKCVCEFKAHDNRYRGGGGFSRRVTWSVIRSAVHIY